MHAIHRHSFQRASVLDGLVRCIMRSAVGRPSMASDDLDGILRDGHVEEVSCSLGVGRDVIPNALGLGVDVDTDYARARQAKRRPDDQSALRASTAAAVNNGRWLETERV